MKAVASWLLLVCLMLPASVCALDDAPAGQQASDLSSKAEDLELDGDTARAVTLRKRELRLQETSNDGAEVKARLVAKATVGLAKDLAKLGQDEQAIDYIRSALARMPSSSDLRGLNQEPYLALTLRLAYAFVRLRRYEDATPAFHSYISMLRASYAANKRLRDGWRAADSWNDLVRVLRAQGKMLEANSAEQQRSVFVAALAPRPADFYLAED